MNSSDHCPVCGAGGCRVIGAKDSWPMARCGACDHLFGVRLPSAQELEELYSDYCYERYSLERIPPVVFARLDEILSGFERHRRTNRILDVGFGAGALLQVAQKRGWEAHGLEFSSLAVKQAQANGFTNALEGDFLQAPYRNGFFDVIVASELLEHLPAPLPFVRKAADLLTAEGLFYLTTPNGMGLSMKLLGFHWSSVEPKEHLHLFSPSSLDRALKSQGFGRTEIRCEGLNPYEIARHFRPRVRRSPPAEDAAPFNCVATSYALNARLTGNRWGSLVKSGANWVLSRTRLGDSLKAIAFKT